MATEPDFYAMILEIRSDVSAVKGRLNGLIAGLGLVGLFLATKGC